MPGIDDEFCSCESSAIRILGDSVPQQITNTIVRNEARLCIWMIFPNAIDKT
jgi:hypothetical protein